MGAQSHDPTANDLTAEQRAGYRERLVDSMQTSQTSYDRTVVALSSGALAISLVFVERFVGTERSELPVLLVLAWVAWAASLGSALASHYLSVEALRRAIKVLDSGAALSSLTDEYDRWVGRLNLSAGALFAVGVVLVVVYASFNIPG